MTNNSTPISLSERNKLIDTLRGFALTGVLIANLTGFIAYALPEAMMKLLISTPADIATEKFVTVFVENKFITLFALLFGYGFGVIIDRTKTKGLDVVSFFSRRMFFLLLIGIIHLAIWWGEILSTYALCGFLLLLFRNMNNRKLLISGLIMLLLITPIVQAFRWAFIPNNVEVISNLQFKYVDAMLSGKIASIVEYNYKSLWYIIIVTMGQLKDMSEILAKFLLGFFIMRSGFFSGVLNIKLIRIYWSIALAIALIYLLQFPFLKYSGMEIKSIGLKTLHFAFERVGILSLTSFYVLSLSWLYSYYPGTKLFSWFRLIGTMSLTNYLAQTLFFVLIFYGTGFGLLGKMHLQWTIPIAVLIYLSQVGFCSIWLKYMRYGPAEWIWRQVSYGRKLPLRKTSP
ncbi:DUF418 domain-containing protein [Pollutibacter soli]|uniref:DUF418 domain-containing protein n=1 Tax=Pollutibacter soli TaxID=3034157 RepID=UPI003013EE38